MEIFALLKISVSVLILGSGPMVSSDTKSIQTFATQSQCERAVAAMGTPLAGEAFMCVRLVTKDMRP